MLIHRVTQVSVGSLAILASLDPKVQAVSLVQLERTVIVDPKARLVHQVMTDILEKM